LTDIVKTIETDLELLVEEKKAVIKYQKLSELNGIDFLIYQLFYNLISNSLKFSKKGVQPVIEISSVVVKGTELDISSVDKVREYVQVVVTDNGIGFDQQYADEIFDTFSRLNNRREYEGTGLGLSLCKSIMERHEGYIFADGKPGEGATFTMLFPM
jgi:signal transduction histidine kinase